MLRFVTSIEIFSLEQNTFRKFWWKQTKLMLAELAERFQRALSDAFRLGLCSETNTITPGKKKKKKFT